MYSVQKNEPGLVLVGVLVLIVFGIIIWSDRPIQSPRSSETLYPKPLDRVEHDFSYISWPWEDPFGFKPSELQANDHYRINNEGFCSKQLATVLTNNTGTFKVLASIVKTHPKTVENKESRTRQRHAVTAGLNQSGYTTENLNRLNYCITSNNNGNEYNVRWEYFKHNEHNEHVILAWATNNTDVNTFIDIVENTFYESCKNICKDSFVIHDFNNLIDSVLKDKFANDIKFVKAQNLDIDREGLANILVDELKLRNINQLDEVVIIREQGAKLADTLTTDLAKKFQSDPGNNQIQQYSYLKGLDANQQNIKKREQSGTQAVKKWSDDLSIRSHHNPPIGHTQFDYLHRLALQIKSYNSAEQTKKREKKPVNAVGIFGSDFYDKLIILQALRQELPNLVYFTTDLDAQMLQPEYWNWTRNLIVASHFDLRLNDNLQRPFPPFRDSLQTEVYYRTLENFSSKLDGENYKRTSSLVFEIGRNGPFFLPIPEAENEKNVSITATNSLLPKKISVHPNYNNSGQLEYYFWICVLISLALIFTDYQMRPNSGTQTIWLTLTALLLFGIIFFWGFNDSEPFVFTDGVSVWPTILIRLFTFLLAIAFILKLIRIVEVSFDRLSRKLALPVPEGYEKIIIPDNERLNEKYFAKVCVDVIKKLNGNNLRGYLCERIKESARWGLILLIFPVVVITTYIYATTGVHGVELSLYINEAHYLWYVFVIECVIICLALWCNKFKFYFSDLLRLLAVLLMIYVPLKFGYENLVPLLLCLPLFYLITRFEYFNVKSIQDWVERDANRKEEELCILGLSRQETPGFKEDGEEHARTNYSVINRNDLWLDYRKHGLPFQRFLRSTIMWLIFMVFSAFMMQLFPESTTPCRGSGFINACSLFDLISVISFSIVMFLIFLVLDAQRLCIHWIEKLRTKHPLLADKTIIEKAKKPSLVKYIDSEREKTISSLNNLKNMVLLVAKRSRVVDQLIYFPVITLMLMLLARIQYFDNLGFPLSSSIVFIVAILFLLYAGLKLRAEASRLKRAAVECAENDLPCGILFSGCKEAKEKTIQKIQEINFGAFLPMKDQPVVHSVLLLLGAVGLFAVEYLMLFS